MHRVHFVDSILLCVQDTHPVFDIHEYGSQVLNAFKEKGLSLFYKCMYNVVPCKWHIHTIMVIAAPYL